MNPAFVLYTLIRLLFPYMHCTPTLHLSILCFHRYTCSFHLAPHIYLRLFFFFLTLFSPYTHCVFDRTPVSYICISNLHATAAPIPHTCPLHIRSTSAPDTYTLHLQSTFALHSYLHTCIFPLQMYPTLQLHPILLTYTRTSSLHPIAAFHIFYTDGTKSEENFISGVSQGTALAS